MNEQDKKELDMNELDSVAGGWAGTIQSNTVYLSIYIVCDEFNEGSADMIINLLSSFRGGALTIDNFMQHYFFKEICVNASINNSSYSAIETALYEYLSNHGFKKVTIYEKSSCSSQDDSSIVEV
ncbi:MAG: hypothetical protein IJN43_17025 [Ruminococcus sp.]|nr:hypothetical protein [Ruminococcus sp.]